MYRSIPGAALALSASLLACLWLPQPAAARRSIPNIRGSYFGSFQSSRGNFWTADLTLSFQSARRVGGQMNLAAIIRDAGVQGVVSPSHRFNLIARLPRGQRPLQLHLRGKATLVPDTNRIILSGTYVATGAVQEKGNFELSGSNNGGPSF